MKWDGSHLETFKLKNITLQKETIKGINYRKLKIYGEKFWCVFQCVENRLFCIIDEIKPLFNLNKLGTHSLNIGNRLYILYRTKGYPETRLKDHRKYREIINGEYEELQIEIQKIYLFRYITQCNINCNSIIIRKYKAYSFICYNEEEDFFNNLFENTIEDIDIIIEKLLPGGERYIDTIFSEKLEKKINKLDKTMIIYKSIYIDRILELF